MELTRTAIDLLNLRLLFELYENLRLSPEDWEVDKHQIENPALAVKLSTSMPWFFFDFNFADDSRSLPLAWRPLLRVAFLRGQRDLLAARIHQLKEEPCG